MGFFSKLFGNKQEDKPDITANLPIQRVELKDIVQLRLTEILQPEYEGTLQTRIQHRRESDYGDMQDENIVDQLKIQYQFELEYVIFDVKLLHDIIGDSDLNEDLNELFRVSLTEFNAITVKVIEGDTEDYVNTVLEYFNEACKDWGIKGKSLAVKSITPTDDNREFYEAYKAVWG